MPGDGAADLNDLADDLVPDGERAGEQPGRDHRHVKVAAGNGQWTNYRPARRGNRVVGLLPRQAARSLVEKMTHGYRAAAASAANSARPSA